MIGRTTSAAAVCAVLLGVLAGGAAASTPTVVTVTPATPGWALLVETATAAGQHVAGPDTVPMGSGSVRFDTSGTPGGGVLLAGAVHRGVRLSQVDALGLATYTRSGPGLNANVVPSIQIGWDPDLDDADTAFKGRLVGFFNPAPTLDAWVSWGDVTEHPDWLWYLTRSEGDPGSTGCVGILSACSWSEIASAYPDGGISLGEFAPGVPIGFLGVKAGSGWGTSETYADVLSITVDGAETVYDLEPASVCATSTSGTTITLLADCVVTSSFVIPDGYTLDGDGHSITAVDPPSGHFVGGVVEAGGTVAHVTDLEVTASGLADVCDSGADRLRGILFDGAGGSITDVHVHGVRQGPSGCQEGNAIEIRNVDAEGNPASAQVAVTVSGATVADYQKNGITANGNVAATIVGNTVTGDGPVTYIAQNGIQIGFGATALVRQNVVTGNAYTPASFVACGLLFFEAAGVRQQANTLAANERNLCNFGRGGGTFNPAG